MIRITAWTSSVAGLAVAASLGLAACTEPGGAAAAARSQLAVGEEGREAERAEPAVAFRTTEGPDALALIIAIADYGAPPAGMKNARGQDVLAYRPLNADNDVPLIRSGLELHGFRAANIRELRDAAATHDGIVAALEALVAAAGPGDVVVIHYSGHGHQLTDQDGPNDELDGYDEVLVPYGAPAELVSGYDGSLHLRDDVLGEYVRRLRERTGAHGSVTVFLDACFSGTGTRGGDEELPARGVLVPLGPPNAEAAARPATRGPGATEGTGLEVPAAAGTRGGNAGVSGLAPFTVLSAARHDEVAHEMYAEDGATVVGSLTYALSQALPRLRDGDTYGTLFTYVVSALHGRVRQSPQIEGDREAVVFRPEFVRDAAPAVRVTEIRPDGRLVLDAGGLVGLNSGSRVSLFPPSGNPAEMTPWASGLVVSGTPTRSVVELDRAAPADARLVEARVLADRLAYGDAALRVALAPDLPPARRDSLRDLLHGIGMIDLVETGADLVLASESPGAPGAPESRPQAGGPGSRGIRPGPAWTAAGEPLSIAPAGLSATRLARRVEDWARNQYLRRIQIDDPRLDVDFELAVVQWDEAAGACTRPDWNRAREHRGFDGGRWSLPPQTDYVLRIRNNSDQRLHFAVIDVMPAGDTVTLVRPLYPRDEHSAQATELPPGRELRIPDACYFTEETGGLETLKLFISTDPIPVGRLIGMRTRSGERGGDASLVATREIHLRIRKPEP